jgi:hypothetical protein
MALTEAIDEYVELLTGDRTKLHAPHHSIDGRWFKAAENQGTV